MYIHFTFLLSFADGTRNPSIQTVALSTAIIPTDMDEANAGGSYMYTGMFLHDLPKVRKTVLVLCG